MLPHIMANIFEGALLEQAQQIVDDGLPKRPSAPSEGRNLLTMLVDIKKCYELLDEQERELLKARYHDNLTLIQMAEKFETSKSSVDRWCENALRSLQRLLGGDSPWS
jgi:RNA polymerase sigma factor (sigma-70 family)